MGKLFGTNGLRGVFGEDLTLEFIHDITLAIGTYFKNGPIANFSELIWFFMWRLAPRLTTLVLGFGNFLTAMAVQAPAIVLKNNTISCI